MFDEAKEVGNSGLRWMKIHLANLAGYDKASFTDRVKFTEENIENIRDSARKPLTVRKSQTNAPHQIKLTDHRVSDGG